MNDQLWREIIEHHTVRADADAPINTSTGPSLTYFDGIGAALCESCSGDLRVFYEHQLSGQQGLRLWPVATGASGALLLGLLGRGTYIQPAGKATGILIRNQVTARRLALIDDCAFTGATMRHMREVIQAYGLGTIDREIVFLDMRNVIGTLDDIFGPKWRSS